MGEEDGHGAEGKLDMDMLLTSVEEAADFVKATNVDALAIAIGTSHGAYKFTKEPTGDILRIDRIKEIHMPPSEYTPCYAWFIISSTRLVRNHQ